MFNRRQFLHRTGLGSFAFLFRPFEEIETTYKNNPVVISTWAPNVKANAAAWEVLRKGGSSLDAVETVSRAMGKETVLVRESPGFITTRVNASIGNEAFYMLMEGVASARDIDKALKLGLNHPMGPFELVDLVGLDTRLSILEYLHRSMGEKYRPCPLLAQYVKAGRLGRKVGKGVYEY